MSSSPVVAVAGVILAGGASRRFGRTKQILDYRGRPFVRVVAETALAAGLSPVLVVTGADAQRVEEALSQVPVTCLRNRDWASGQSSSVRAGVLALPAEVGAAVFLLADQPQVTQDVVRALVEAHARGSPPIVVPTVDGRRANPVLFDRATFRDLLSLSGDVGGRQLFANHSVEDLPWPDPDLLLDVDTPEDYRKLHP